MNLTQRWLANLESLRAKGRLRSLRSAHGVDFTSNDYLGYSKGTWPATSDLPASGTASRLLRGHHPIWDEVESALARWHGVEAALVFPNGYMANLGLLSTVIEPDDCVASDALNHASIIDGIKLSRVRPHIYSHGNCADLETRLRTGSRSVATFIVTESLFSMEADLAPLSEIVDLADRHGAHVIVDEAHATGCFGPQGSGLVDAGGLRSRVLATVHTGGKALGVPGAYVCCSALLKQLLVNRCRQFIFTTALPPQVGAWWLAALERVRQETAGRQRLHDNARLFRSELSSHGIAAQGEHYIVPVQLGDDNKAVRAAERLQKAGFDIRAIRPPTVPDGTARLRISIHADHDADTLRRAARAVAEAVA